MLGNRLCSATLLLLSIHALAAPPRNTSCKAESHAGALRRTLPECWYQRAAAIKVVTFKKNLRYAHELSLQPAILTRELREIRAQGFSAIEIFAPAEGGTAYNGLDTKNEFRIDPELGSMADFQRAIHLAH